VISLVGGSRGSNWRWNLGVFVQSFYGGLRRSILVLRYADLGFLK